MCGLIFVISGFVFAFWSSRRAQVLYSVGGTVLSILYLAIDTQLIMGGKRFQLTEEDYIFATLNLYLDFVQLFLFTLGLIRPSSK